MDETLKPTITIIEDSESDKVCHASATIAIEPVVIPTQYFRPKSTVLSIIDSIPSRYP
jgi:hypothetical protein